MDAELAQRLQAQDAKLDAIWQSVEKTRKYFQMTFWITVILFVLPLVGLIFVVPYAMSSYLGALGGGDSGGASQLQQLQQLQRELEDLNNF